MKKRILGPGSKGRQCEEKMGEEKDEETDKKNTLVDGRRKEESLKTEWKNLGRKGLTHKQTKKNHKIPKKTQKPKTIKTNTVNPVKITTFFKPNNLKRETNREGTKKIGGDLISIAIKTKLTQQRINCNPKSNTSSNHTELKREETLKARISELLVTNLSSTQQPRSYILKRKSDS